MRDSTTISKEGWPYAVPRKALQKWVRERVTIAEQDDGSSFAMFRYSGSTCSNMGHPLTADLKVIISPIDEHGLRWITSTSCQPAENDLGVTKMCACLQSPGPFLNELDTYRPLEGMDLESAIRWEPKLNMAGCLCAAPSRNHKWRNAIQAIHFALNN